MSCNLGALPIRTEKANSMGICFRPTHLFLAAACLCMALTASTLAQGQTASSGQERRNSPPAPQSPTPDGASPEQPEPITEFEIFGYFIDTMGLEDARIQWQIREGRDPVDVRINYGKMMQISANQDETMRTICLDAYYRVEENDRHSTDAGNAARAARLSGDKELSSELPAKAKVLNEQRPKFYTDAIASLRLALGEETFNKVENWLYENEICPKRNCGPIQRTAI